MKKITLVCFALVTMLSHLISQTPQANLDKYWAYRERLKKNFLKIGNDNGESIPISARSIGFAYSGAPLIDGNAPSRIYHTDATIYLGHYLWVLATEYKLTANQLQAATIGTEQYENLERQKQQTLIELYYAIATVNRLDEKAEAYIENNGGVPQSNDRNGFLLRNDVPKEFYLNFLSDYSEIFEVDADMEFTDSDWYASPSRGHLWRWLNAV